MISRTGPRLGPIPAVNFTVELPSPDEAEPRLELINIFPASFYAKFAFRENARTVIFSKKLDYVFKNF